MPKNQKGKPMTAKSDYQDNILRFIFSSEYVEIYHAMMLVGLFQENGPNTKLR